MVRNRLSTCTAIAAGLFASAASAAPPCPGSLEEQIYPPPAGMDRVYLRAIEALGPDDIWAVGDTHAPDFQRYSLTLHYDGSTWTHVPSPQPQNVVGDVSISVHDVDAVTPNLIYAAGGYEKQNSTYDTFVLRWDGSQWEHVISPGQSGFGASGFHFEAVHAIAADDVWFGGQAAGCATGSGYTVHYDGSSFEEYCIPSGVNGAARVRDIDALSSADVWAVGAAGGIFSATGRSYVIHWDGSSWALMNPPELSFGEILYAVEAIAPDDVWAAGVYQIVSGNEVESIPLFWHWDGSSWTQFPAPAFPQDLLALASDDIYSIGGDDLMHWDGISWSLIDQIDPSLGMVNMLGIDAVGPCRLVAAGFSLAPWEGVLATFDDAPPHGDFDGDGDVDIDDFNQFAGCFTGPGGGPIDPGCEAGDLDADGDIDCDDWNLFVQAWSGPGPPPPFPQCLSAIPTVSEWGMIVMTLLLLAAGTLVLRRRTACA